MPSSPPPSSSLREGVAATGLRSRARSRSPAGRRDRTARRELTPPIARTYEYEARAARPRVDDVDVGPRLPPGILRGDFPAAPIAATLGFAPTEFEHGRAVFEGTPERYAYNPLGYGARRLGRDDPRLRDGLRGPHDASRRQGLHDGRPRRSPSSARSPSASKKLRCEAKIIHAGGSVATAEGRIIDEAGTLYAHGTTTCLVS